MAELVQEALLSLMLILIGAKVCGEIFARLGLTSVVGEVIAGLVLGPSLLGLVPSPLGDTFVAELILVLGEIGAILLLFEVGLESDLRELLHIGPISVVVAALGLVGSFAAGFAGSFALAKLGYLPDTNLFHIFVGAAMTATSVGITARILSERRRLDTTEARILLGAAVLDDMAGLIMLAVVGALAAQGAVSPARVGIITGGALGFLVGAILIGVLLAPRLARLGSRATSRGGLVTVGVVSALGLALLADMAGLAAIVGAFVAGTVFTQSDHNEPLFDQVHVLGNVFTPIFFVVLGLMVDLGAVITSGLPLVIVAAVLTVLGIAGKLVSGFGVTSERASRTVVGVGMVPRGEVGFIFALLGLQSGIFTEDWQYPALLLVMLLTTVVAPLWLQIIDRRVTWHGELFEEDEAEKESPTWEAT